MTKIYIIDNKVYRASVYGIGTYIKELENSLRHSGLHVCFIHLNSDTQRFIEQVENSITHWYIPLPKIQYKDEEKNNKLYFQNTVFVLRQYIQSTDSVIFHLNFMQCKTFADALKTSFDCKVILTVHYLSWCFEIFGNISRLRHITGKPEAQLDQLGKQVKKSFTEEKELFFSVDHVLCLSKHTSGILQNIYGVKKQNISIIYNGLEDKISNPDKPSLKREYHLPDIPVIFFAGRLDGVKGLTYALQAFRIVLKTLPDCHFLIAGNGDFDIHMKECEDIWMHITWTGLIGKEKLYDLYSIADIGVMPSFHEQCSYVAIEMMMHGLPVIASTSTGLSEMIDEGITGLHIPVVEYPESVEIDSMLLSEKMLYLLQHPDERKCMGSNARRRYKRLYSAKLMREHMVRFYHGHIVQ